MQAPSRQPSSESMMRPTNVDIPAAEWARPGPDSAAKLSARNLNFFYGTFQALRDISMRVYANQVPAFIGPSGCGKSTFLRTLNRMNETVRGSRVEGEILLDGADILNRDVSDVRRRVGMVFQKSNPFPTSSFDNYVSGPPTNSPQRRT